MTDSERLSYFQQQFESVKNQVAMWEGAFGQLNRNNEGIITMKGNLAALSISSLIGQYNQLLTQINAANKLLDPNAPQTKSAKEAQLKDINDQINKLVKVIPKSAMSSLNSVPSFKKI